MTMRGGSTSRRALASVCLSLAAGLMVQADAAEKRLVYVGTYTNSKTSPSEGVYKLEFDPATGALTPLGVAGKADSPSFLAFSPDGKHLYAAEETGDYQGEKAGSIAAFAVDPRTGDLKLLNRQSSKGAHPCHVSIDPTGKVVLTANYSGGSVACLPVDPDGSLRPASAVIQHQGHGADASRQKGPHAHSANFGPAGKLAFVADLGLDKVMIYDVDAETGKLSPHEPASAKVEPGRGPRHLAWAPSGKFAYVITEMGGTVDVFAYDSGKGELKEIQSITTLPADNKTKPGCAEVVVHPSGKFVYGSNRGHDSLAIYKADPATGKLTAAGWTPTGGKNPRNFVIDPTGGWLLAANQDSDSILVFKIDQETGGLTPTGSPTKLPKPVCIRFLPQPSSAK